MGVPTRSVLVSTLAEINDEIGKGFRFPAMAIPFGSGDGSPCMFFMSGQDIDDKLFAILLDESYPMPNGVRGVHLITTSQEGLSYFRPGLATFELIAT